jgi:hypothetical protein
VTAAEAIVAPEKQFKSQYVAPLAVVARGVEERLPHKRTAEQLILDLHVVPQYKTPAHSFVQLDPAL